MRGTMDACNGTEQNMGLSSNEVFASTNKND